MRLVSICPSNTEILYFLGAAEQIVGIDDHSDWPPSLSRLPKVGPDLNIDMEKVKALKPDLVIASLSVPGMEKNIEELERLALPYLILNPKTLEEIAKDFATVGKALGIKEKGMKLSEQFLRCIEEIHSHIPEPVQPIRLYWEWWPKPVFTPGKRNWLTEVSQVVKAVNIFQDVDQESVQTNWEEVRRRKPDRILVVWTGIEKHRIKKSLILSRKVWQGEAFAKEEHIQILDEGWYCRPSPRLLTGIRNLAHLLHPLYFDAPHPEDPFADNRKKS
jgi:iron complex transport system substrate-binding protein